MFGKHFYACTGISFTNSYHQIVLLGSKRFSVLLTVLSVLNNDEHRESTVWYEEGSSRFFRNYKHFLLLQAKDPFAVINAARASPATKSWHVTSAYTRDCGPTHARCAASVLGARTTWRSTRGRTNWDCLPHSICCCHRFCMRASRVATYRKQEMWFTALYLQRVLGLWKDAVVHSGERLCHGHAFAWVRHTSNRCIPGRNTSGSSAVVSCEYQLILLFPLCCFIPGHSCA